MKIRLLASTLAAMTLLLSACGQKEDDQQASNDHDNQKESKSKQDNKENHSKHKENLSDSFENKHKSTKKSTQKHVKDVSQLSNNEKVALALFEPSVSDMAVTANELLNHSYRFRATGNIDEQRSIGTYKLNKIRPAMVTDIPQGTTFYEAHPGKGGGVTLIGISQNQVIITGGQAASSYQQLVNESFTKIFDVEELNKNYGNNPDFKKVAGLISISNSHTPVNNNQSSDDSSDSDSTSSSSSSSEKVTRENVIDKVEAYEGHKLDTSKHTFKEPEKRGDGSWDISILDKAGNLEGSYKVNEDGSVEKYDEQGQRI